jgi:class 3 adenylate cyclase
MMVSYGGCMKLLSRLGRYLSKARRGNTQTIVPEAVVGFADIVASTQISNELDVHADFELRRRFQEMAAKRAGQWGITILNDTGDGIIFMVDQSRGSRWYGNLLSFYDDLRADFQLILDDAAAKHGLRVNSGVRFGVGAGAILVANLRGNSSQASAIGPEVNLAARLCAKAEPGEIVFSRSAWNATNGKVSSVAAKSRVHTDLKGFAAQVPAMHLKGASF